MLAIRTILHPTDFSPRSEYAFRLAGSLARDHGARLVVLHVTSPPVVADGEVLTEIATEGYKQAVWDAFRHLQESDPKIRELRVDTQLVEGDPAAEILRVAEETGCDLIIMGTHGRTGLERVLMGSVAEQVVRKAPCPVLTVKAPLPAAMASPQGVGEASGKALRL
jgi:nucleotide-binding universal stress UspA family protein